MNTLIIGLVAGLAMLGTSASLAHGGDHHADRPHRYEAPQLPDTSLGRQGEPTAVTRTIVVEMADDMRFTPEVLVVERGETVRLNVVNKGELLHELVLGTSEGLDEHSQAMRKQPGMEHDEPQMVHVQPGEQGEILWQFGEPGEFRFACLLPGHFDAGMVGRVVVH